MVRTSARSRRGGRSPWSFRMSNRRRSRSSGWPTRSLSFARRASGSCSTRMQSGEGSSGTSRRAPAAPRRSRRPGPARAPRGRRGSGRAEVASRRVGAGRPGGARRSGEARAPHPAATARGGRPRRGAEGGRCKRRHPGEDRGRRRARVPARARHHGTRLLARRARPCPRGNGGDDLGERCGRHRRPSRSPRARGLRQPPATRSSTGCATVSTRSAAS